MTRAKVQQKLHENKRAKQPPDLPKKSTLYLDTLEQLDSDPDSAGFRGSKITLQKRARRKTIAKILMNPLIDLHSSLEKSYKLTSGFCVNVLLHEDNKITASYCGYRWCPVCNSIRTGKLINGYLPAFRKMVDPHFITLTAPTVKIECLDSEIDKRNKIFFDIRKDHKNLKNKNRIDFQLNGIRKLEVTPRPDNFAHPHYHLIVDGKEASNFIIRQWLDRIPEAELKAQDMKPIDETGLIELFKYVTKFWSKDPESGNPKIGTAYQMDQIYQALKKRRTIQPFGNIRIVSEEIYKLDSIDMEGLTPKYDVSVWNQAVTDWIDTYGEMTSGYKPSERDKNLITLIEKSAKP